MGEKHWVMNQRNQLQWRAKPAKLTCVTALQHVKYHSLQNTESHRLNIVKNEYTMQHPKFTITPLIALTICLSFCLIGCDSASKQSTVNYSKTIPFDSILNKVDTIYLGNINAGEQLRGAFAVMNDSDTPVIIKNIITSCGCTSIEYKKEPIKPGESRVVEFLFDSKGMSGYQLKVIDVLANNNLRARMIIESNVI